MNRKESELYRSIKTQFGDTPAEEKIQILRSETLRTLSAASGYSELVLRAIEGHSGEELSKEILEYAQKSSQYIKETLDVILALSDK